MISTISIRSILEHKLIWFLHLITCLVLTLASCGSTPSSLKETEEMGIKIGVLVPLSGIFAQYMEPLQKGINSFQQRYLDSSDFELIYYDNESDLAKSIEGCEYLINKVGVDLILGPLTSQIASEIIPICDKAGIPIIPLWATRPDLTSLSSSAFRIVFSDRHTGYLLAKFCVENLNSTRVAVISGDHQYQEDCYKGFTETFSQLNGGQGEVRRIQYDNNPSGIADQIADFRPDVVYMNIVNAVSGSAENFEVISEIESRGFDGVYIGDMTWSAINRDQFYKTINPEIYYINHFSADSYEQSSRDFAEYYKTLTGSTPDSLVALGYETISIVHSLPKERIIEALQTGTFQGLLGQIKFDANGDAFKSAAILRHSADSENEYITTIKPEIFSIEKFEEQQKDFETTALEDRKRLAVLELENINVDTVELEIISKLIGSAITQTNQYIVIEESHRDEILGEWETSLTGITEEQAPFEIGNLLQARNVITGSVARSTSRIIVNLSFLDIETGVTLYSSFKIYNSFDILLEDCRNLTYELLEQDI